MKQKGINLVLLAVAALTLVLLGRSVMQEPVVAISREVWEYYHTSVYSGYPSTPNRREWNPRLLKDDLRYARQAGDLEWLDQLKRVQAASRCQTPRYNWYPADHMRRLEAFPGQLRDHDVGIVVVGDDDQMIRPFNFSLLQSGGVRRVAD